MINFKDIETLLKDYWEAEREMHKNPALFRHLAGEVANNLHDLKIAFSIILYNTDNLKMEVESLQEELLDHAKSLQVKSIQRAG